MRAFVISGPNEASVEIVDDPHPEPGEAVVEVRRVGVCGTDVAFFTGSMPFLADGRANYPMRIGHEWTGVVVAVGSPSDAAWIGRRVVGDTMLGCRRCARCASGRQHTCATRLEVGVLGGKAGAVAEAVCVPVTSLFELPDAVDDAAGALVEPGGNAVRAVEATALHGGDPLLIIGPGTIGLLAALVARSHGIDVHLVGRGARNREFAATLGFANVWTWDSVPAVPFRAAIDASNDAGTPDRALGLIEPGGRLVCVGLAGEASLIDTRRLVFNDVTVVGILSGSPGMQATIDAYASGAVDPRPLVATTVGLDGVSAALAGGGSTNPGPKVHIDPRQ